MWFTGNLSQPADLLLDWSSLHGQATGRCKISSSVYSPFPSNRITSHRQNALGQNGGNESRFLEARPSCPHSFDRNARCRFAPTLRRNARHPPQQSKRLSELP